MKGRFSLLLICSLMVSSSLIGCHESDKQLSAYIPLNFSAPFPSTPFVNAHKSCVKILESTKAYCDSLMDADIHDKIIDQFLTLNRAIGEMKKEHSVRQLRCDDVEFLIQVLQGVESMFEDIDSASRSNIICARILCGKANRELMQLLSNYGSEGCVVAF